MKYKLETIPVIDAIKEDSECPVCLLMDKAEAHYVKFYTGASVMNPETRVEVNKVGFCREHHTKILEARQAQNVGLLTHTYMMTLKEGEKSLLNSLRKELDLFEEKGGGKQGQKVSAALEKWKAYLTQQIDSCMICGKMEFTMKRYLFTIVYNWLKDPEFRDLLGESRGFCQPHLLNLVGMAQDTLPGKKFPLFLKEMLELQERSFGRLEEEVLWFTQKFKAENSSKPWGTSEDAHIRSILKLTGKWSP